MKKHFTASVYILDGKRILLIFHPKLKKWLPPGGHIEPNESPVEAARREVKEEVGLDIEIIPDEHVWVNHWNAKSFPRPFLCLAEEIPATEKEEAHEHLDLIYRATTPNPNALTLCPDHPAKWLTLEEIESLEKDVAIFAETQEVARVIFEKTAEVLL